MVVVLGILGGLGVVLGIVALLVSPAVGIMAIVGGAVLLGMGEVIQILRDIRRALVGPAARGPVRPAAKVPPAPPARPVGLR